MAILSVVCPQCSGTIQLDNSREFGFCSFCGQKIMLVEKVQVQHSGSVQITGVPGLNEKLERARQLLAIENFSGAAFELGTVVTSMAPNSPEAWLLFAEAEIQNNMQRSQHAMLGYFSDMPARSVINMLMRSDQWKLFNMVVPKPQADALLSHMEQKLQSLYARFKGQSKSISLDDILGYRWGCSWASLGSGQGSWYAWKVKKSIFLIVTTTNKIDKDIYRYRLNWAPDAAGDIPFNGVKRINNDMWGHYSRQMKPDCPPFSLVKPIIVGTTVCVQLGNRQMLWSRGNEVGYTKDKPYGFSGMNAEDAAIYCREYLARGFF